MSSMITPQPLLIGNMDGHKKLWVVMEKCNVGTMILMTFHKTEPIPSEAIAIVVLLTMFTRHGHR